MPPKTKRNRNKDTGSQGRAVGFTLQQSVLGCAALGVGCRWYPETKGIAGIPFWSWGCCCDMKVSPLDELGSHKAAHYPVFPPCCWGSSHLCPQQLAELAPAFCSPSNSSSQELLQPEPWLGKTWGPGSWGQPGGHSVLWCHFCKAAGAKLSPGRAAGWGWPRANPSRRVLLHPCPLSVFLSLLLAAGS